ncbi:MULTISPECIES: class II aldolase/adducin family protein [Clostridiaceae]|uniref:Class II aldolase/adducin family protein n=1 Tax=Clostridium facile TaxID=2763035 RepID=A0ABR7IQC4_9CLOT|nr:MULTISPECIES: class II aldolase/adducin family protein [Clostridiaceae]MBC5787351.1 class II aldolase/adducin family protein [Clostridium facile]
MVSGYEIKKEICEIGRRIYMNGFVAANDGNITVKISDNEYYCTPTGVSKGFMTPDMICKVDAKGNKLEGRADCRPSSEVKMHMRVFAERPDVTAVVHAHPPVATAHAVCNIPLDTFIMPEAVIFLGTVPICEYGTPSTNEIPDSLMPYIQTNDSFLLKNHGALTIGNTLEKAYFLMESTEFFAKVSMYCRQLGGAQQLDCDQINRLLELRKEFGVPGAHPGCPQCEVLPGSAVPVNSANPDGSQVRHPAAVIPSTPPTNTAANVDNSLIAEITKKVIAQLNK